MTGKKDNKKKHKNKKKKKQTKILKSQTKVVGKVVQLNSSPF